MRARLDKQFFPFVIKPGRYAGGEPGQIVKDPQGRLKYLHAFPDKYELGQSYLGLQTIYHIVNQDDRFLCERVFAVDQDAETLMRDKQVPLFSLETSRPAVDFDVIGFTLPYELIFTNVLAMLDLAGIPLKASDRSDEHPIIMAGGPAVYNPEPMASFVDLFFIGDAEQGLPQMLAILHQMPQASREEKLLRLAHEVESVYVPRFYSDDRQPVTAGVPQEIRARVVPRLKPEYFPTQPLVPLVETVHDHLGVEVMRGCPQGCRFCQAGPMYRPVRVRPAGEISDQILRQLAATGYHEITLVSLSTSDYPEIEPLIKSLARKLQDQQVSIALPSLRPGSLSRDLLSAAKLVRKSGLTLAPEAGTERLRMFIRKNIPDEALFESVRLAFDMGWSTIKLYFMIGLPTETDEDLDGIIDLVAKCYGIARHHPGKSNINVTLSPFVPKPHTPFQWDAMISIEETIRRIQYVRQDRRVRGVNFKHHRAEMSLLAGLLGRGGREFGPAIEAAYERGCRFDGWSESFQPDIWFDIFKGGGIDIEQLTQAIPFDRPLPWSHIRKGISTERLQVERRRTSTQLKSLPARSSSPAGVESAPEPGLAYGRKKRKLTTRNTSSAPTKNRLRIQWGKTARCRYMSHLENMRLIERSLRRARLPVAYSQGFNPTMKLSFGPPLPLGFTSEAEFVDITLDTVLLPYMIDDLRRCLPEGVSLIDARAVIDKGKSLSAALNRVVYTVPLDSFEAAPDLEEGLKMLLDSEQLPLERQGKGTVKVVDVRPAIHDLRFDQENLIMVLGVGEGGYARPTEVAGLLMGAAAEAVTVVPCHRQSMYRQDEFGRAIAAMDL
ncbi:MAG: TIGR03960 family B12-binding radical SAM protein [bacterium]